jgi:acyl carrier protein
MDFLPSSKEMVALAQMKLSEIIEVAVDGIDVDADLLDELAIDSLQHLELVTTLERELGIRLTSEEWRDARTLSELAQILRRGEPVSG